VEAIACVFDKYDLILRPERNIVKTGVLDVALKKRVRAPWSALLFKVSFCMAPNPPKSAPASVSEFVSPVSSKKNSWKCEPGRNCPFSGLLKGVPPAALAKALALKGTLPCVSVS